MLANTVDLGVFSLAAWNVIDLVRTVFEMKARSFLLYEQALPKTFQRKNTRNDGRRQKTTLVGDVSRH